jgi:hypothetical protein
MKKSENKQIILFLTNNGLHKVKQLCLGPVYRFLFQDFIIGLCISFQSLVSKQIRLAPP